MAKNNPHAVKPDLEIPRTPSDNHFRTGMFPCLECGTHTSTRFDLGGHGSDPCCPPCFARMLNIDSLDYDVAESLVFPLDDATIVELGLRPMGESCEYQCGCKLTNITFDNGKTGHYITRCDVHLYTMESVVIPTDLENEKCLGFGMTPCPHCWGVSGADITPEWTARCEITGCDCNHWGA